MTIDVALLRRLAPLLDVALDLPAHERLAWVAQLDPAYSDLKRHLQACLAADASNRTWLEHGPVLGDLPPDDPSTAYDFAPGDRVGPYQLIRLLGTGGMGEVWLAKQAEGDFQRAVALKLPTASFRRAVLLRRFERERDILAGLVHPNIARLYDAGISNEGQPYLALEYVDGLPITGHAQERGLDAAARVALLRQVMEAIQHAHANLVIHRDLKPGNLLVTGDDEVRLLDFGIAKLLESEHAEAGETELTQLGGRPLTLQYAAPEQLRGAAVSTATDIWSLGALLYELLTDQRPVGERNRLDAQGEELVRPPSTLGTGVIARLPRARRGELDAIVLKAMRTAPSERYTSASAMADDLARWESGEPVLAQPDSRGYRLRKFVGRHRLGVGLASAALILVLSVSALAVVFAIRAGEESARAIAARDFLFDMFRQTDPDRVQGQDITVKQFLRQGHATLLATMAHQPRMQAELLERLGYALEGVDDPAAADAAHADAAKRHLALGDPRAAAHSVLDRAVIAADSLEDVDRLRARLDEAASIYPPADADDEYRARFLTVQIAQAFLTGDLARQRELTAAAEPAADRGLHGATDRTVFALRTLAESEGQLGQTDAGIRRLNALLEVLQSAPATPPGQILGVLSDLAELEFNRGQIRVAHQRYEDANTLCNTRLNPRGGQCDFTQYGRARILLLMGYRDAALGTLPNLLDERKGWQPTNLVRAYAVLAKTEQLARYPHVADSVARIGADVNLKDSTPRTRFTALLAQGEYQLQVQNPALAKPLLRQAREMIDDGAIRMWYLIDRLDCAEAMLAQAEGDAALAVRRLAKIYPAAGQRNSRAGFMVLHLAPHYARALWAAGRRTEALAICDEAEHVLEESLGNQAPTIERLKRLRADLAANAPTEQTARLLVWL